MEHAIRRNRRRTAFVVVLFVLVWIGAGALLGAVYGSALFGALVGALLGGGAFLYAITFGRQTVLSVAGASLADPAQYPELHHIVEALAIGDGLPKPAVYVIDDPSPNAFATGLSPQTSIVAATTGLLGMMNREELEGVLSHEMSHIRNHDVRLLLVVSTMVGLAAILASILWHASWRARRAAIYVVGAAAVLSIVGLLLGPLMQLAISRHRESLADESGVALSRNPAGLLSALRKLAAHDQPLQHVNHVTAAMYIDNPLEHHQHHWFHGLFDTHPPIADRIAELERIAAVKET